jgi:hypothetical protein
LTELQHDAFTIAGHEARPIDPDPVSTGWKGKRTEPAVSIGRGRARNVRLGVDDDGRRGGKHGARLVLGYAFEIGAPQSRLREDRHGHDH